MNNLDVVKLISLHLQAMMVLTTEELDMSMTIPSRRAQLSFYLECSDASMVTSWKSCWMKLVSISFQVFQNCKLSQFECFIWIISIPWFVIDFQLLTKLDLSISNKQCKTNSVNMLMIVNVAWGIFCENLECYHPDMNLLIISSMLRWQML